MTGESIFYLPLFCLFQRVKAPFVEAIRETLGDRFTISIENVFIKTLDFLLTAVENNFREYEEQKSKEAEKSLQNTEQKADVQIMDVTEQDV